MSKKISKIRFLDFDIDKCVHVFFNDYCFSFNRFFANADYEDLKKVFYYNNLSLYDLNRFLNVFNSDKFKHYFTLHEIAYYIIQSFNIEKTFDYVFDRLDCLSFSVFPYPNNVPPYVSCIYDVLSFDKLSGYVKYIKQIYKFLSLYDFSKYNFNSKLHHIVCHSVFIELNFLDFSVCTIDISDVSFSIVKNIKK